MLIVDDSLTVRMDLRDALHDAGFLCQECATLSAAREALRAATPDAVILDVLLPDGDGLELLETLRASSDGAVCPVLILSSETELSDRVRGLSQGAEEYVGKPYDKHFVVARMRELVRGHRQPRGAGAPATVLVVDDSMTFRELLAERLVNAGYQVLQAATGEDGLRVAASERPLALLIDSVLPGLDGPGVIRRLRLDAALRGTPCILLTAADEQDAELRALDAGADAFVRKQDDLDIVVARLAAVLRSASVAPATQLGSLSGPKRLLAIDDSPTFLAGTADALREEGFDVMTASSGEEAIDLLAVQNVDCILMDLIMPGLGGRETCQRIKAAPRFRDIPLIMLTGVESREAMLEALEAGADDYVQKSGEFEVLKARVRAQLRRKQFEDDNRRIREELLAKEKEAAEARAARELAQSRATLLAELSVINEVLELRNKELASANNAKTEFLSMMSHELRTPLNAVIGFSEILMEGIDGPLSPRQTEFLGHINSSGQHLLSLINDILDLAKIEAGKFEIELAPLDLDALLSDALGVVSERAFSRKILLERHWRDLSVPVHVDGR
ncbi:MAG: response regulator, partial [Paucibacter sp.]|nr:response regulator [Roseateles sp.]